MATSELKDVSDAVHRLIVHDIRAHVSPSVCADPNTFRQDCCYRADVCRELERHEASLRLVFACVAKADGRTGIQEKLVAYDEWIAFLRALGFVGTDLTDRDARLAFVWSRMCVIDNRSELSYLRDNQLPFEGFIEAICRVAALKALPTDAEISDAGCSHAGSFLKHLSSSDPAAYELFLQERRAPWGELPSVQPIARCVAHTLALLISTIEIQTRGSDNLRLTEKEVSDWMRAAILTTVQL